MSPWVKLAACVLGIGAVWGWLLPAIGSRDDIRASIELMNQRGINPGAIFYTDVFPVAGDNSATEFFRKGDD